MNTTKSKKINRIEDILLLGEGRQIIGHEIISKLTAPGEGFCSLLLRVDVSVATSTGTETIYAAAKIPHPNENVRKHFSVQETFYYETSFYKNVIPVLQKFQQEYDVKTIIDVCPRYYGSRLDAEDVSNTVLLLENLKVANYTIWDKTEGFDLTVSKLVVAKLAQLHAVPLALKLQKPDTFEKDLKPYLAEWHMNRNFHFNTKRKLEVIISGIPELSSLKQRILTGFDKKLLPPKDGNPFATVIHNDCWVCNVMVKLEGGVSTDIKFVDFQQCIFGSLAKDLVLFLFSSIKIEVLERYYDDLIRLYYKTFTSILQELKCDVAFYSFENFEKELEFEARHSQFGHILFLLFPIFAPTRSGTEEYTIDSVLDIEPTDLYKKKLLFVVEEFARRNWI